MSKVVLKIEFDNQEAARHFAVWMAESGEQDYWDCMAHVEDREDGKITAIDFEYNPIADASKPEDSPERYGDFLADNTIRTVCGRLSDDEDDAGVTEDADDTL